jgi:hypothetical protein
MVGTAARSLAAANSILLPKPKPRTMRQQVVMPSIRGRDVARAQRPGIRHRVDALQPLDLGNGPFSVHPSTISTRKPARSIGGGMSKDAGLGFGAGTEAVGSFSVELPPPRLASKEREPGHRAGLMCPIAWTWPAKRHTSLLFPDSWC